MRYADEIGFYVSLAVGITFFVLGFKPLFKAVVGHIGPAGLKEAIAV